MLHITLKMPVMPVILYFFSLFFFFLMSSRSLGKSCYLPDKINYRCIRFFLLWRTELPRLRSGTTDQSVQHTHTLYLTHTVKITDTVLDRPCPAWDQCVGLLDVEPHNDRGPRYHYNDVFFVCVLFCKLQYMCCKRNPENCRAKLSSKPGGGAILIWGHNRRRI